MLPLHPAVLLLAALFAAPAPAAGIDTLEKSVVRIFTDEGTGSGAIVADKVVLTNAHVVHGARHVQVVSQYTGGRELDARVLWVSEALDLAVLQVAGLNLPSVTLATRRPDKGAGVRAFGYPDASDMGNINLAATVTRGVISNFHQRSWRGGGTDLSIIQHDAVINPGNSGGPLFDLCGRVVGVNTAGRRDAQGTFFASRITEAIPGLEHAGASLQKSDDPCTSSGSGIAGLDEVARQQADAAQQEAGEAREQADVAQQEAGTALRQAGAALQQAERAGYISLIIGLGVGLLALAAIALALRKPRRQIIEGVGQAARVSRRYLSSAAFAGRTGKPRAGSASQERTALVLAGFDAAGKALRITVPEQGASAAQGGYVIGRHAMLVDQGVEDASVSRRHARIIVERGQCRIEDMNSTHGTRVNDHRLSIFKPAPIAPGDKIALGAVELQVSGGG